MFETKNRTTVKTGFETQPFAQIDAVVIFWGGIMAKSQVVESGLTFGSALAIVISCGDVI